MIELTVKTLDSKNHVFSVPDDLTVKQLKEHIADSVNIPAESQRLIYCGRVLQDDKNLSEYDVNGKVIHLVQRAPPVSNGSGPDQGPSTTHASSGAGGGRRAQQWRTLFAPPRGNPAMYVGAMAFPAEFMDASGISMQQPRSCLTQSRLSIASVMLQRASLRLDRLENPPQESSNTSPENGNGSAAASADETATNSVPIQVEIAAVIGSQGPASVEAPNVEGPNVEVQNEPPTTRDNEPPQSTSSSDQQPSQNGGENESNSRSSGTRQLARLMEQVGEINTRVQPFMAQYRQLMLDDLPLPDQEPQAAATRNQRLFNTVSEVMHILAHCYHALSDIMCDLSQPPPRQLRCRPVLIQHSAVYQTDIPIQVSASLGATTASSSRQPAGNGNGNSSSGGGEEMENQSLRSFAENLVQVITSGNEAQPATGSANAGGSNESSTQRSSNGATSVEEAETEAAEALAQAISDQQTQPVSTSPPASASATPQPSSTPAPGLTPPLRITRVGPMTPGLDFFIDVSPSGSIMIDSVEAHVVTNAPPGSSSASTDGNTSQNPPEFVQNLITALAGQFMGATLQQYQTQQQQQPQAASSSPQTTSSSPQATSSSPQTGGGPAAPAAAQNSQARGNTATHPTTATQTRSTARPHQVHLSSPTIHAMRPNTFDPFLPCNSHHIHPVRPHITARRINTQPVAPTTSNARESENGITIQLRTGVGNPPRSGGSAGAGAGGGGGGVAPRQVPRAVVPPHMPPEVAAIYQAIRNPNTSSTLAQLLLNVPGYSYTPGESIFTDVFITLAQSLSFMDMVQLGLGNSECLVRARPQLRELISLRFLNNQPLTISAITQIIDRFNNELRPYYNIFDNARLREEIDLPASINLYNHSMLPSILNTVMEESQNTFHRTLMRKCSLYVRQLCALLLYCCLDSASGLETILRSFVNQMTTGVPGFLQEWTVSHSVVNFRTFIGSLNVPVEDIKRFLVYRVGNPSAATPQPATSPQPATTPPPVPPAAEPMDVQEVEEASADVGSAPTLIREPSVADVPPTQAMGWQNALPSDWVPIITRDSQRQRRQSPASPFSDAYLSGMPSKRRKLITSTKPQGNLSQVISESMAVALGAASTTPSPVVDLIAGRAGQDRNLRTAYREQVRTTLSHNLASNQDYTSNPDKYPNTAKYFNQQ